MQQATSPARIPAWCTRKMNSAWARARKSGSSCSFSAPCCRPRCSQELPLPSCAAVHSAEMSTILTLSAPVPGFFRKQSLDAWVSPRDGAWLETDDGLQTHDRGTTPGGCMLVCQQHHHHHHKRRHRHRQHNVQPLQYNLPDRDAQSALSGELTATHHRCANC